MIRLEQEPLRTHTTFRIGGPAAYYFEKKKLLRHWILQKKKDFLTM